MIAKIFIIDKSDLLTFSLFQLAPPSVSTSSTIFDMGQVETHSFITYFSTC